MDISRDVHASSVAGSVTWSAADDVRAAPVPSPARASDTAASVPGRQPAATRATEVRSRAVV